MTASTLDDLAIPQEERERRLARVLGRARTPVRLAVTESTLFAVGGALAVGGVVLILLGWLGTSRTVLVAGQIPYVVSGGLLGLGFIFLGGFLYFGYWLATLVRDGRSSADEQRIVFRELRDELAALHRTLAQSAVTGATTTATTRRPPPPSPSPPAGWCARAPGRWCTAPTARSSPARTGSSRRQRATGSRARSASPSTDPAASPIASAHTCPQSV